MIGSRSIGGVFLVCAALTWVRFDVAFTQQYTKRFPLFLLIAFAGGYILSEVYTYFAIAGFFGDVAQGIADFQSGFYGNILLGGRPEIIVNLAAFLDSPLIGHGPLSVRVEYINLLVDIGVYSEDLVYSDPEVLYHSMLFGAAHEGGFPAMLLWLFLTYKIAYAIPLFLATNRAAAFIATPFLVVSLWHIIFSPLIAYNRWLLAFAISLAFLVHDMRKRFAESQRIVLGEQNPNVAHGVKC